MVGQKLSKILVHFYISTDFFLGEIMMLPYIDTSSTYITGAWNTKTFRISLSKPLSYRLETFRNQPNLHSKLILGLISDRVPTLVLSRESDASAYVMKESAKLGNSQRLSKMGPSLCPSTSPPS